MQPMLSFPSPGRPGLETPDAQLESGEDQPAPLPLRAQDSRGGAVAAVDVLLRRKFL